jgi:PAS domain S-box-containing protein
MHTIAPEKWPIFSRYVGLTVAMFAVLVIAFAVYVAAEKQVDRANELRLQSFLLADELRQSSDDLTRMARTYVVTGDPHYKEYYQAILDIRDGKKLRPQGYQLIYWDQVQANGNMPRPDSGQAIALLDLLRHAGFTAQELSKLEEAKVNSDDLTRTEFEAMQRIETLTGPTAGASRAEAILMMHDALYHQAKASIMKPINEFYQLMDARTAEAVRSATTKALLVRSVFIVFALSLVVMLWHTHKLLRTTLGGPVDAIYAHLARLGRGDFSLIIAGAGERDNSVLGWLAKTQANLQKMDQQRKQNEEATINALRFQQELMDAVPLPIFYKDVRRVYLGGNKAFENYLALTPEQFIGKTVYDLEPADLAAKYDQTDQSLLDSRSVQTYDAAVVYADGTHHEVIFNKAVFTNSAGEVAGLIGVILDVTERKQVEAELLRSNAELEQFSYSISHDMRQPLRMISSYLQLLQSGLGDTLDAEKREYFNFAIDGAQRLDAMLRGLLDYSRIGRKGESPVWIESRTALDEALLFLRPLVAEAQAEVRIEGEWPKLFVRPDEMLRLLQNLVGNALKFRIAGRTPEIVIHGYFLDTWWLCCIADNGVGILPEQIGRLFQVFQRLQSRIAYEGTGIGLALCRKIVEHHGGTIRADSPGENQGSTFCFDLPLRQEEGPQP